MKNLIAFLAIAVSCGLPFSTSADVLILERFRPLAAEPTRVWRQGAELTLVWEGTTTHPRIDFTADEAVMAPDGRLYSANVKRVNLETGEIEWEEILGVGSRGIDVSPDGSLLIGGDGDPNGVVVFDPATRSHRVIYEADRVGFILRGLAVPRSGPRDGEIVLLGKDEAADTFSLRFLRPLADGTYELVGETDPLDLAESNTCPMPRGELGSLVLAMRPDGLSVLVPEKCSMSRIKEFDLDGTFLGIVATLEIDEDAPWPPRARDNRIFAVHVDPENTVWAAAANRVWRITDGTVELLPHEFGSAVEITDAVYVPFESETAGCRAHGHGWWKRQCLSSGEPLPRLPRVAGGRVPAPPEHPSLRRDDFAALLERVDDQLERHDVTACAALWNDSPREPRARALAHLAGLLLDVADKSLSRRCLVPGPDEFTIGDTIDRIHELLDEGSDPADREAARLAARAVAANSDHQRLEGRR